MVQISILDQELRLKPNALVAEQPVLEPQLPLLQQHVFAHALQRARLQVLCKEKPFLQVYRRSRGAANETGSRKEWARNTNNCDCETKCAQYMARAYRLIVF